MATSYIDSTVDVSKPISTCVDRHDDECPLFCLYSMQFTQIDSTTASFKSLYTIYQSAVINCDCTGYDVDSASISGNVATGQATGGLTGKLTGHSTKLLLVTYSNSTGSTFCQLPMLVYVGGYPVLGVPPNYTPGIADLWAPYWWGWTIGVILFVIVIVGFTCLFARCCRRERTSKGEVLDTGVVGPFVPIASSAAPPMAYVVQAKEIPI